MSMPPYDNQGRPYDERGVDPRQLQPANRGRSYAEREVDPSLLQPANPFRQSAVPMPNYANMTTYMSAHGQPVLAEGDPSLVYLQEQFAAQMYVQSNGQIPQYAAVHDLAVPHLAPPPSVIHPASGPHFHHPHHAQQLQFPSSNTSYHHHHACQAQVQHEPHRRRGLPTPVLSDSSSPSSSISSMSDVAPPLPPQYGIMYDHTGGATMFPMMSPPPVIVQGGQQGSPAEQQGFELEGSVDPADLEDEEYQATVDAWISANPSPANRPDTCSWCNKQFNRHCDFRRHVETIHVKKEGGYPCPIEGCGRRLCRKDVMQRHIKKQHWEKEKERARRVAAKRG